MAKKNKERREGPRDESEHHRLHPDTKKSIWAIVFIGIAIILSLAAFDKAGPAGEFTYKIFDMLFGWGYFLLPATLLLAAGVFLFSERERFVGITLVGAGLLILSALGLIEILSTGHGGWLGLVFGSLRVPFGDTAAIIINIIVLAIAVLVTTNVPLRLHLLAAKNDDERERQPKIVTNGEKAPKAAQKGSEPEAEDEDDEKKDEELEEVTVAEARPMAPMKAKKAPRIFHDYVPPPLSLLNATNAKPTTGDLLANANVIKRTLDSFGIPVEMGEINVGPSVTRYTLKPAEGVKLSRITALSQDLALALAAHPIRIEAPIPGKSLVGIEVPNKAAALVRLGSLMSYPEFQKAPLGFILGRDVSGEPIFSDIERMPHLLIAGATGSGKSITIHSLLVSLLYKNSPSTLKLVLIDPKRVELSIYQGLPHLVAPVVTESKKSIGVFRWAIEEMDRRYDLLQKAGSRDIKSYNSNGGKDEPLPYLAIVVDELADLMTAYGREVEGSIVRLAQMARATGIHLVLSTQRPSVEVITGLIKANITSRIALQVASQVDSRTILDTAGAEKLLGHGDLLYISSELSKPKRIQGAYISEEEINKVADFIRDNNKEMREGGEVDFAASAKGAEGGPAAGTEGGQNGGGQVAFDDYMASDDDDELYEEAVKVVAEAQKASASLLQRRLKVGYARAARLLDIMEEKGVVGPGDGAKPRDVYVNQSPAEGFGQE